jgi:hypothetical protein
MRSNPTADASLGGQPDEGKRRDTTAWQVIRKWPEEVKAKVAGK